MRMADQFFLNNGQFFNWNFNAQISAGNHYAVRIADDIVDILKCRGSFNFSNNSRFLAGQNIF